MELIAVNLIRSVILPPGLFLLLMLLGLIALRRKPWLGRGLIWLSLATIYLLSTPLVADRLVALVETYPALEPTSLAQTPAQAIVILSAGRESDAVEYGGDSVGVNTLIRCRYGAYLHQRTGLPVVVSGGWVLDKQGDSLARVMANLLLDEFQVREVWLEESSRTTAENALYTQQLLAQKRIDTVLLVTQARHMPRAVSSFEKVGLKVIAAPTAFRGSDRFELSSLIPGTSALHLSRVALHEMIGAVWYDLRH